jgi:dTDP-4-dehydrorhamnose 3,5-epimerase
MSATPGTPATAGETSATALPRGVTLWPLQPHRDERGSFAELYRQNWATGIEPRQWGLLATEANVLRGMHVHPRHDEFIAVTAGRLFVALKDLRPRSPSYLQAAPLLLTGETPALLTLPRGVAHGFYAHTSCSVLIAATAYYDPTDDLGCLWSDPDLGIDWPCRDPQLSARDRDAPPLASLVAAVARADPGLEPGVADAR